MAASSFLASPPNTSRRTWSVAGEAAVGHSSVGGRFVLVLLEPTHILPLFKLGLQRESLRV